MDFSPVLQHGYRKRTDHEADLTRIMDLFKQADHTVFLYPPWWGSLPAQLKGLVDRVFLPGHFFEYKPGALFQTKLMKGKTARVITTMDMPLWFEWLKYRRPGHNLMKKLTLEYCEQNGVDVVRVPRTHHVSSTQIRGRLKDFWNARANKATLEDAHIVFIDHPRAIAHQPFAVGNQSRFPRLAQRLFEALVVDSTSFEDVGFVWELPDNAPSESSD